MSETTKWEINKSTKVDAELFLSYLETQLEKKLTQAEFFELVIKNREKIAPVILEREEQLAEVSEQ